MSAQLKTQADIAGALGITKPKLSKLIHDKKIELPPVIQKIRSTCYYDPIAVDKLIKSEPLKAENMLAKANATRPGKPELDNNLALKLITSPRINNKAKTFADIVKKHTRQRPKTTVVHLEEHHEYTP